METYDLRRMTKALSRNELALASVANTRIKAMAFISNHCDICIPACFAISEFSIDTLPSAGFNFKRMIAKQKFTKYTNS